MPSVNWPLLVPWPVSCLLYWGHCSRWTVGCFVFCLNALSEFIIFCLLDQAHTSQPVIKRVGPVFFSCLLLLTIPILSFHNFHFSTVLSPPPHPIHSCPPPHTSVYSSYLSGTFSLPCIFPHSVLPTWGSFYSFQWSQNYFFFFFESNFKTYIGFSFFKIFIMWITSVL